MLVRDSGRREGAAREAETPAEKGREEGPKPHGEERHNAQGTARGARGHGQDGHDPARARTSLSLSLYIYIYMYIHMFMG